MGRKKLYKAKKNWIVSTCVAVSLFVGFAYTTPAHASNEENVVNKSETKNDGLATKHVIETAGDTSGAVSEMINIGQHVEDAIDQYNYNRVNSNTDVGNEFEINNVRYTPTMMNSPWEGESNESMEDMKKNGIYADGVPIISYNTHVLNHDLKTTIRSADQSGSNRTVTSINTSNHIFYVSGPEAYAPFDIASNFEIGDTMIGNGRLSFNRKTRQIRIINNSEANAEQVDEFDRLYNHNVDTLQTIFELKEENGVITNEISYFEDSTNPLKANITNKNSHPFQVAYDGGLNAIDDSDENGSALDSLMQFNNPLFRIDNTNLFYNYAKSYNYDDDLNSATDSKPITLLHIIKPFNNNVAVKDASFSLNNALSILSSGRNTSPIDKLTFFATGKNAKDNKEEVGPDVEVLDAGHAVSLGYQEAFLVFDDIKNMGKSQAISFIESLFNAVSNNDVQTSAKSKDSDKKYKNGVDVVGNVTDGVQQISELLDDKKEKSTLSIASEFDPSKPVDSTLTVLGDAVKKISTTGSITLEDIDPLTFGISATEGLLNSQFNLELAEQRYKEATDLVKSKGTQYQDYKNEAYKFLTEQQFDYAYNNLVNNIKNGSDGKPANIANIIDDAKKSYEDISPDASRNLKNKSVKKTESTIEKVTAFFNKYQKGIFLAMCLSFGSVIAAAAYSILSKSRIN